MCGGFAQSLPNPFKPEFSQAQSSPTYVPFQQTTSDTDRSSQRASAAGGLRAMRARKTRFSFAAKVNYETRI